MDFLRYYAGEAAGLAAPARGVFACISPWNFPLAIFTGQIAAALAAGNGVIAKPAEATGLIAHLAVTLLHEAGVPRSALQLLPGRGAEVGAALSSDPRIAGICFTGSTATAQAINRAKAVHLDPVSAPLNRGNRPGETRWWWTARPCPSRRCATHYRLGPLIAGQIAVRRYGSLRAGGTGEGRCLEFIAEGRECRVAMGESGICRPIRGRWIETHLLSGLNHGACRGRPRPKGRGAGRAWKATAAGSFVLAPVLIDLPGGIAALEREVFGPRAACLATLIAPSDRPRV